MEGNGGGLDRKLFAKLAFLCSPWRNIGQFVAKDSCRSNPYYPATRIIIIVKNRSLLLSDNNHANICLRYVPNDASRQRSHVRDRDSRSSSQRLFAIQSYDKNDIVCATLAQRYNLRFTYCIFCSSSIFTR